MKRGISLAGFLCGALFASGAGAATPTASPPRIPAAYSEAAPPTEAAAAESGRWWSRFGDPVLDDLIARGTAGSPTVEIAAAHLAQARAAVGAAKADQLPQISVTGSASKQTGPLINAAGAQGTLFELGASLAYDPATLIQGGKLKRAAQLDARSAALQLADARLAIQAGIAQTYFALRAFDAEEKVLAASLTDSDESVAIAERRLANGTGSELDLARLREERGNIRSEQILVEQRRAISRHALVALIGTDDASLDVGETTAPVLPVIPAGLPSTMLTRRGDVAASATAIDAASLRLKAARTNWFPSLGLTTTGGFASPALGNLLRTTAQSFGLNLLLSLPIFDGGRRRADFARKSADLQLAAATYRDAVFRAFQQVEDQLSTLKLLAEREETVKTSVAAANEAATIAERRFTAGAVSRLDLLDIRRRAVADQRALASLEGERFIATVALIRALGGGWGDVAAPPSNLALQR